MILLRTVALVVLVTIPHTAWATPIVIQEVLYDAPGPDAPFAFTELVGPPGISLDGWSLVGVNGSTGSPYRTIDLTGSSIPLDGIFVIATASASIELAAERDLIGNVDWQNGPDAIQLRNTLGEVPEVNPNRKIFEARKRETAALGAGEKLVLGHPLAATIGDSARCMQNLEKVLFTGPKTSDTVTFICD